MSSLSRGVSGADPYAQPFRAPRRRKDRHGRAQRQVFISPKLPAWRTRRDQFDEQVAAIIARMRANYPAVDSIEFAVEEVPPSDPAPWEDHDVCLARVFPRDRSRALADRIVVYRQAVRLRCRPGDMAEFLELLLAERISTVLAIDPEDLLE